MDEKKDEILRLFKVCVPIISIGVTATYIAATVWLLTHFFAELYLPSYVVTISRAAKLAMCLLPNGMKKIFGIDTFHVILVYLPH